LNAWRTVPLGSTANHYGYRPAWCWPAVQAAPISVTRNGGPLAPSADEDPGARPGNSSPVADGPWKEARGRPPDPSAASFLASRWWWWGAGPAGAKLAGSLVEPDGSSAIPPRFSSCRWKLCRVVLVDAVESGAAANNASQPLGGGAEYLSAWGWSCVWAQWWGDRAWARSPASRKKGNPAFSRPPPSAGRWGAGLTVGKTAGRAQRLALGSLGRVLVEPDFSVPGHRSCGGGRSLQLRPHQATARRLPAWPARRCRWGRGWPATSCAQIKGEVSPPFRWLIFGSMAVIGPLFAVADLRGLRVNWLARLLALGNWATWPPSLHRKRINPAHPLAGWQIATVSAAPC